VIFPSTKRRDEKMSKHVIHPIATVTGLSTKTSMTYRVGEGQKVDTAQYIWYIEGPTKKIIVDTGDTAEELASRGLTGKKDLQLPEDALGKLGLKPSDIDIVIVTHLHPDHIALAHKYTRAKFIVQRRELAEALYPHPIGAPTYKPFNKSFKPYENLNYEVIEGDKEIVDGIKVLLTPGHTPGTQSVAIETVNGLAVIFGGCTVMENFYPTKVVREKWPLIVSGILYNPVEAYDSMVRIKEMAKIIIPIHAADFVNKETVC
jgi:glyoxylase-like metal-dependent hydrolase (beta-lactamase superfamily II)